MEREEKEDEGGVVRGRDGEGGKRKRQGHEGRSLCLGIGSNNKINILWVQFFK